MAIDTMTLIGRGGLRVVLIAGVFAIGAAGTAATASNANRECDIVGTEGDDTLHGTDASETICGLGGNGTIYGHGGRDLIKGGAGDDRIRGGPKADRLSGGAGNDWIEGGKGDDEILGGSGHDVIMGEGGTDTMYGGPGDDRMAGGDGTDHLLGRGGPDEVSGGLGDDLLSGGHGDDTLKGGREDDEIRGGPGSDTLTGGRGRDFLIARDGLRDSVDGGKGRDSGAWDRGLDRVRRVEVRARGVYRWYRVVDRHLISTSPCARVRKVPSTGPRSSQSRSRLDDRMTKRPTFSALDDGTLTIELTVTDDERASDTASAMIKVRNIDPVVADIGPFEVAVGEMLVLDPIVIRDRCTKDTHMVRGGVQEAGRLVGRGAEHPIRRD